MSSYTSSSKRRLPTGLVVLAMVILVMAGLEVVTRTRLIPASMDLKRFARYPEQARALGAGTGRRVAFVGNSFTGDGIDPALFGRIVTDVTARVFDADNSSVNTWMWIIEREFWKQGVSPDLVIINFDNESLEDGRYLEIGRLAFFFTDYRDWPELFRYDVTSLEERADFLLSSVWATYAVRARIKERALGVLPGYRRYVTAQNQANFRAEQRQRRVKPPTHKTLLRLLAKAQAHRTPLLFVAIPRPGLPGNPVTSPVSEGTIRLIADAGMRYPVPEETIRLITDAGMRYLDLRRVPGLENRHYADDVHLTPEGQAIYTRHLAELVRATWNP